MRSSIFKRAYDLLRPDSSSPYIIPNWQDVVSTLILEFDVPEKEAKYEVIEAIKVYRSLLCLKCRYRFKRGKKAQFSFSEAFPFYKDESEDR